MTTQQLTTPEEQLAEAGRAAIALRNELDRMTADCNYYANLAESWKAQFQSAAAAASEYSEFWERHSGEFDSFGNYIPHSQMDGDLRAAKAEIERLRKSSWECMGRKQSLPEPGECNWPDCGCDPHATKVIESLIEQGWTPPTDPQFAADARDIPSAVGTIGGTKT